MGCSVVAAASWELEAVEELATELPKLGRSLEAELRPPAAGTSPVRDEGCVAGGGSGLAASWRLSAM